MESYKDVMLSQAPAMYDRTGQAPGISLENYKGILLSARPANLPYGPSSQLRGGPAGTARLVTAGGEVAPAFVPAGSVETPAGLGPSAEERATMERNHRMRLENYRTRRANACTVLTRHKRWLRSFAEQVRKMKDEEIQREIELARRAEQIRQQQAQKRAEVVALSPRGEETAKTILREEIQYPQQSKPEGMADTGRVVSFADDEAKKKDAAKKKKKKKPKWALTEDEALEDELAATDDLLEFAKNLDYDKFIDDYEVAGALAIMRERVEEIARENNWSKEALERAANESVAGDTEDGEDYEGMEAVGGSGIARNERERREGGDYQPVISTAAAARKAAPHIAAGHTKEWDGSKSIGGVLRRAIFRDTLQLAERILASSKSMQKIHTKFSLARVLQRCVLDGTDATLAMQKPSIGGSKGLDTEPRVVNVHPDATGLETGGTSGGDAGSQRVLVEMQRSKERTQGLPYLYRCPAI
ncbi:uncharacterized protein TM35_000181300 [Trypanosoma theileri]|uniref:Uncharacterized protein n=1 Tax=Trypanosoma theileri TaxID=67003 RepID=A0A1X0NUB6_9TRYP|nr:uncharacterized protein TM35_000181300 [Trypanosoma theileri]ORC88073.1 hypothetical protein TM35_000181300 [Trypanosoma theileri]